MLTPTDAARLRQRLEAQREELTRRLAFLEGSIASPERYVDAMQERGDDASLLGAHEEAEDEVAFVRGELDQVDRALARIADGTYGLSEVSGRPIPLDRLDALPTATTLVDEAPPD